MYLTAVINIGDFDYIPCKQYIKNPNKFIKKFIQKAKPGLYTLNFDDVTYVCLKTETKQYIFDSINQKFTEEIDPLELISDLLYTINNSNSKKKLLSMMIIILCKSFKWPDQEITKLLSYADYLDNNKELKETIVTDIYNNNKPLYNVITGGATRINNPRSRTTSSAKQLKPPPALSQNSLSSGLPQKNLSTGQAQNSRPNAPPQYNPSAGFPQNFSTPNAPPQYNPPNASPQYNPSNASSQYNPANAPPQYNPPNASPQYNHPNASPQYNPSNASPQYNPPNASPQYYPNMQDMQKFASMVPIKNMPNVQDMQKFASMLPIKNMPNVQDMQKYASMLPIKNIPIMQDMKKYYDMIPQNVPKDTILGTIMSMLFSFVQGIPFIGYPFIIYETIQNIINGNYSSLLIKPLKFVPGLGFIINLFTIFGKFGKLINLISS